MTNDEMRSIWAEQSGPEGVLPAEEVWRLAQASERFERTIFWRDAREWIATLLVVGAFLFFAFAQERVHWLLVMAALVACFPMTYVALRGRKEPPSSESLTGHLRESIASLRHQIALLRSVLCWYLAPLFLSILFVFVDRRQWERGIVSVAFSLGLVVVLFFAVWLLNRHAVRTDLQPRLRKLEETLAALES